MCCILFSGEKREYSNFMKSMQGAMGSIQSLMPSVEDLFNGNFLKSWEAKVGNLGVSECSSSSTNQIEEKGDDNDDSLAEMVLETPNVEDAKNKQEKGSSKRKKSKKNKGKKK